MNADSTATRRSRRWALLATVAGFFCLLPTALATVAWYRHAWHYTWAEFGPTYVRMTALYAALLSGPILMFAGGALSLVGAGGEKARWSAIVGSTLTLTFSLLGLAVRPPDLPVRVVVGMMAAGSLAVLVLTLRRGAYR